MRTLNKDCAKQWCFFGVVLCILGSFLIWKAHYGYIFNDEPFMVTLGHRLLKGDGLFIHEWNTTQLIGIFFVPFIYIYTMFKGDTEGLILFCRIVYVFWWLIVGTVLYRRIKRYGWISIIAVSMFLLYTPLDEMTLTYNAMSLSLLILFSSYFLVEGNAFFDYINGVVLALAVLAYPTVMSVYFTYLLAVTIKNIFKIKANLLISRMLSWKVFLRITFAAAIIAAMLLCYLFSIGMGDVFKSLSDILSFNSNKPSIFVLIRDFADCFKIQTIIGGLLLVLSLFDKKRNDHIPFYMVSQTAVFFITAVLAVRDFYYFNIIVIPLVFLGVQAFILITKKDYALITLAVVGIVFAFCGYLTSDTGLMAFSNGFVIINMVSIIFIYQLYKERIETINLKVEKYILCICVACIFVIQLGGEFYIKCRRSYWDATFSYLNTTINCGVAKGIITTPENADYYNEVYADAVKISEHTSGNKDLNFLSLSLFPSIYLDLDYNYGTYSSWTYTSNALDFKELNDKLTIYYKNNPSKKSDVIYISYADEAKAKVIDCVDFSKYQEISLETGIIFVSNEIIN